MFFYTSVITSVFMVICAWSLCEEWRSIQISDFLTADEKTVLSFQSACVVPILLLGLVGGLLDLAGMLLPVDKRVIITVLLALIVVLTFLALTSIIYRVSIIAGRRQQWPARDEKAIVIGVVFLGIALVALIISLVFFFLG